MNFFTFYHLFCSGREDMAKERAQASFNTREMTYFMDGGEDVTKVKGCYRSTSKFHQFFLKDERSHDAGIRT
jgi:hypothetical protein